MTVDKVKAAPFQTFGPDCCQGAPLHLQLIAVLLISAQPVGLAIAIFGRSYVAAGVVVAVVVAPRLLWQPGTSTEGPVFAAALGFYWNLVYFICFASPLIILVCVALAPRYFIPLSVMYYCHTRPPRYELRGGRPWPGFARLEWGYHAFRHFLGLQLRIPGTLAKLPPTKPVILACHPHGIASDYRILMDGMLYEALPGRPVFALAASVLFKIPLVRELGLWTRCIDACRPVAERALRQGNSLMILPGGEREQIRTKFQKEEVFLPGVGFVSLALKEGASLVPVYVFGCVDLYKTYSFMYGFREWVRKQFRICIPVFSGSFGVLPRRVPLTAVFGEPLDFTCATPGEPSSEEIEAALKVYVSALKKLFDDHKAELGYGDRELTVEFPEVKKT